MEDYTNNSHKARTAAQQSSPPVETSRGSGRIVKGEVKARKKSELKKLADTFIPEGVDNARSHIVFDILIPAAKDMVWDVIGSLLYGDQYRKRAKGTSTGTKSNTPYRNYYQHPEERSMPATRVRVAYEVDDYPIPDRGDAECVLAELDSILREYGTVKVSEYYEALGVTPRSIDYKYGWTDLRNAYVDKVREGWIIRLPRPCAM